MRIFEFLVKVSFCDVFRGLLVPTIFRCAVGEGLGYVIVKIVIFKML